jgi:hypothetical protein
MDERVADLAQTDQRLADLYLRSKQMILKYNFRSY